MTPNEALCAQRDKVPVVAKNNFVTPGAWSEFAYKKNISRKYSKNNIPEWWAELAFHNSLSTYHTTIDCIEFKYEGEERNVQSKLI